MQQPNPYRMKVMESNKWLFDYFIDGEFYSESYDWFDKWVTKEEAREWFKETFDYNPQAVICISDSRFR